MRYDEWGTVIDKEKSIYKINYYNDERILYLEKLSEKIYKLTIYATGNLNQPLDIVLDIKKDNNKFIRKVGKNEFTIITDNYIYSSGKEKYTTYLKGLMSSYFYKLNFLTLDIETYVEKGQLVPYAIGIYGKNKGFQNYYLTDYENKTDFIYKALSDLFVKENNGHNVYVHNLSNFDSNFLLSYLHKFGKVDLKMDLDYNIKEIKVKYRLLSKNYSLSFMDSYNILNQSLEKLTKSFKVENVKGKFPYHFVNKDNLGYVGSTPSIENYKNISNEEYKLLVKDNWDLREETIKYLKNDVVGLYQVMEKYSKEIFKKYHININKCPTMPSITFKIFRTNYMDDSTQIGLMKETVQDFIREGYYGGRTEVFKPFGKNITSYDVNSLYPFAMKQPMPTGACKHIRFHEPLILKNDSDLFGFFKCKVKSPKDIKYPILPLRTKESLIFPTGEFEGIYFSEELKQGGKGVG